MQRSAESIFLVSGFGQGIFEIVFVMLGIISTSVFLVPVDPVGNLEANFGLILFVSSVLMCFFGIMGTHRVCGVGVFTSPPSSSAFDCISRSDVRLDVGLLATTVGLFAVCSTW